MHPRTDPQASARNAHRTESEFGVALDRARRGKLDLASALALVRGARRAAQARELFATASRLRDLHLPQRVTLTAHLHMVTPCEITPACRYCSLSSSIPAVQNERAELSKRALARAVRYAVDQGIRSIVLVGGTAPGGADVRVRKAVETAREAADVELALDVGPSLSPETVEGLKREGIRTVYCSVETVNPRAFRRAKPGDDLEGRIRFNAMLERHGMTLGNVVMNGLGSTEDLVRSVLYLRRFRRLGFLHVSTFHPVRGTPWAGRRVGSVRTSLSVLAMARLAFPAVQLGLAEVEVEDPGSAARVASQLRAGGGNTFAALLVYGGRTINHVARVRQEAAAVGFAAN